VEQKLNGIWRFAIDPDDEGIAQQWANQENQAFLENKTRILVPSSWNRKSSKEFSEYNGIAWFWRKFSIPSYFSGKHVYLRVNGMANKATVFIDTEEIGSYNGSFLPFEFDITKFTDGKDHFIAIRIDGSAEANRYLSANLENNYLGIFGDVWIRAENDVILDEHSVSTKLFFEADNETVTYAELEFSLYIKNRSDQDYSGEITVEITRDYVQVLKSSRPVEILKHNSRLSKFVVHVMCDNNNLWCPENPFLYNINLSVESKNGVDITMEELLGIRETKWENGNFMLNGLPYEIKGFDFEIDDPNFGYNLPLSIVIDKMRKLKEININSIRPNKGIFSKFIIEIASRIGIMVFEDIPLVDLQLAEKQTFFKPYVNSVILEPSLILWSVNRKSDIDNTDNYKILLDLQKQFTSQLDPNRNFLIHKDMVVKSWIANIDGKFVDISKE
jgi:beta-galactosidase/beta-glucuronidase